MTKVSIIIPVYNTEKYIKECLDSILNQTLKEIEIIAVNDGSVDDTLVILKEYEKEHEQIVVIDQLNSGQSAARNKALQIATGKYVYFMDSDDLVSTQMLEELFNKSEKENLDVIYFSGTSFFENRELEKAHASFKNSYLRKGQYLQAVSGPQLFVQLKANKDYSMSPCLQMIRREHLLQNKITFCEGIIHEDNCFSFMLIMKAERAFCVNDIYFYRRVREESVMTKELSHKNLRGYFVCLMEEMEFVKQLETNDLEVMEKIAETLWLLNFHVQDVYNKISEEEKEKFIQNCTAYERYFFEAIIRKHIETKLNLSKMVNTLKKENKELKKAVKRAAQQPPHPMKEMVKKPWRLIKGGVRCCRTHGFFHMVKQGMKKIEQKFK